MLTSSTAPRRQEQITRERMAMRWLFLNCYIHLKISDPRQLVMWFISYNPKGPAFVLFESSRDKPSFHRSRLTPNPRVRSVAPTREWQPSRRLVPEGIATRHDIHRALL